MTAPIPRVCGEPASVRLMRSLDYRLHPGARKLTLDEVAVVLRALADHTAITDALRWSPPADGLWPEATSMGRWFHDVADDLERMSPDD